MVQKRIASNINRIIGIVSVIVIGIYLLINYSDFNWLFSANKNVNNKVWVYIEIQKILPHDTTDYYYYGQVNQSIFDKINDNPESKGLFILSEMRFWDKNDLFNFYADDEDFGFKVFQIQDIKYVSPYKKDPIFIFELDELHENTKAYRLLTEAEDQV